MTTNEKVARRKLSLLELAKELNNVSKACKLIGYSRQQFYEIRRNYQTYGAEGLLDKLPGCKGAHPNRVAPEIEQAILDYSLTRPTHGPLRVAHGGHGGQAVERAAQHHDHELAVGLRGGCKGRAQAGAAEQRHGASGLQPLAAAP